MTCRSASTPARTRPRAPRSPPAYGGPRDDGLIELRRGRGAMVLAGTPARARLLGHVRALVSQAHALGLSEDEVVGLVRDGLRAAGS